MAKKSKIYNKGKRNWLFNGGISCPPGTAVELPTDRCEKYVKLYPNDFILGDQFTTNPSKDIKKLIAENKALKAEIAELKKSAPKKEKEKEKEKAEK